MALAWMAIVNMAASVNRNLFVVFISLFVFYFFILLFFFRRETNGHKNAEALMTLRISADIFMR